jgi:hypothetical protein
MLTTPSAWTEVAAAVRADPVAARILAHRAAQWLAIPTLDLVTGKRHLAVSGDPHDYHSIAPYVWPDPTRPDGRPWRVRDGEVNPLFYEHDNLRLELLCHAVPDLILQAQVAGQPPAARHASALLRAFFLDSATRMNPHLRYAQAVPGANQGSFWGIIDTTSLVFLCDAVVRLGPEADWSAADAAGLRAWAGAYLDWLLDSPAGRQEAGQMSNHGTWYDAQVVSLAAFAGRPDLIPGFIDRHTRSRIAAQIAPDGSQPHELLRTLACTYCVYNLLAFACLARIAISHGHDLWEATTTDGRSLRQALAWMLPFLDGTRPWPYQQLKPFRPEAAALLIALARGDTMTPAPPGLELRLARRPWQRLLFSKPLLACRELPGLPGDDG